MSKVRTRVTWSAALAATMVSGCIDSGTGGFGEDCSRANTNVSPVGPFFCNEGLVCNTARNPPICEDANAQPVGGPCAADYNCQIGLWCDVTVSLTCASPLPLGAVCSLRSSCGLSGFCLREGGLSRCVLAGTVGEPCADGTTCTAGLSCVEDADAGDVPRCVAPVD